MNTENRFRAIGVLTLAAVLTYAVMGTPTGTQDAGHAREVPAQVVSGTPS